MATFQRIVIYSALIVLVIILVIVGINLHVGSRDAKWPPNIGDCPDYWHDEGTKGSVCTVNLDEVNKGTAASPHNFAVSPYTGDRGTCNKYRWAIARGVSWDGITYGAENPCIKTKKPN